MTTPVYAFGAYGTNNVGDEAIFDGLRRHYPDAVPIYVNKLTRYNGIWYADILEGRVRLAQGCLGIIGGGGLLHSEGAIRDYAKFALAVREAGGRVEIRAIGAEGVEPRTYEAARELAGHAERITARTSLSVNLLGRITGRDIEREPDFAFSLPVVPPRPLSWLRLRDDRPVIGVVTGRMPYGTMSGFTTFVTEFLNQHTIGPRACHFLLIPHAHAYTDPRENDMRGLEHLWSSIEIYSSGREARVSLAPFSPEPADLHAIYANLDGVVAERFHAMVFAHMYELPTLALCGSTKNSSFVQDYPRPQLFAASSGRVANSLSGQFLDAVEQKADARKARPGALRRA